MVVPRFAVWCTEQLLESVNTAIYQFLEQRDIYKKNNMTMYLLDYVDIFYLFCTYESVEDL